MGWTMLRQALFENDHGRLHVRRERTDVFGGAVSDSSFTPAREICGDGPFSIRRPILRVVAP